MPAIPPLDSLNDLAGRAALIHIAVNATTNSTLPLLEPLQAVYYVLVAACLVARKTEWLRNACLAAALVLPAIAAIHGIVLAAIHVDGAVDMDIYGALQLCAIGILTAPATVRLSNTYFNNPGRNILFIWTVMILTGLIALTVEFFRSSASPCMDDGSGHPLLAGSPFPYNTATCGFTCSVEKGPWSPMRHGSADNIYVIPAPHIFSFGAATLVAAACCVPGILSIVSTWDKILRTNFAKQFGGPPLEEVIEGTNGATVGLMKTVNGVIRRLLNVIEVPVFGGAVLALIIVGEMNFWSGPVRHQTEPMANVGQWGPIVASVFAACGSLYLLLAKDIQTLESEVTKAFIKLANALGTASPDRFDDSEFRHGKVTSFPEVPGESHRNSKLSLIREQWGQQEGGLDVVDEAMRGGGLESSILGVPTSASPESIAEPVFPNPVAKPSEELEKTRSQGTVVTLHEGVGSPAIVLSSEGEEPEEALSLGAGDWGHM
ncbi:hypothetical protein N0V88_000740 [Collariella sp. IMI 366227]|nr:hypothetical protein N0V88_000740 [Collariella sp. IMI 366227]